MILLYALKATGLAAAWAAFELAANGQCAAALMALPMLAVMWYATRLYQRRGVHGGRR